MAYDGTLKFDTAMDTKGFQKGTDGLNGLVKGLSIFKVLEKGFQMVGQSIESAVVRYDTLNKFPQVLQNMGYGASAAGGATKKLSDGVQGLPTKLDEIVSSAQRLTVLTGNLDESTDTALALNNAFLASGSSSADASRGLNQYVQMLSSGKVDMQSWRTLQETMGYALNKTAEAFGFAGASAQNDLYAALQSGDITFSQFNAKIIELNNGVGGFAAMAKTSTGGIGTAWANMQTAVVRGTTSIISSIDTGFSKTRFKSIENIITSTGKGINTALKGVATVAGFAAENMETLLPITIGVAGAFTAYSVIGTVTSNFKNMKTAVDAANVVLTKSTLTAGKEVAMRTTLAAALANETTAEMVKSAAKTAGMTIDEAGNLVTAKGTIATTAETAAVLANSGALSVKAIIAGVLTGQIGLATAAQWLWNAAMAANPIGLLIAGAAVLIGIIVGLAKAFNKESEESIKLKENVEKLEERHNSLKESMESIEQTAADETRALDAQAISATSLIDDIKSLTDANGNAGDNAIAVKAKISQLNDVLGDSGVYYDEVTGQVEGLTDSTEEYIKSLQAQARVEVQKQKYNDLLTAQAEADLTLVDIRKQMNEAEQNGLDIKYTTYDYLGNAVPVYTKEYQTLLDLEKEAAGTYAETQAAVESMDEAMQQLYAEEEAARLEEHKQEVAKLAEQYGISADSIQADLDALGITTEEWVTKQEEAWKAYEQAVKDKTKGVINSFNEIPGEYDKSAAEMLEVLKKNKENYARWEENMEEITKQLGPTAAAEFAALGPEANSAMEEILGSTELLEEYRDVFGVTIDEATGLAVENWNDPEFIGAPSEAIDTSAQMVTESTALADAATGQVEQAHVAMTAAVESVDFTTIGQTIADNIKLGITEASMTGALDGVAATIRSETGNVTSAVNSMSTSVQTVFRTMSTQNQNTTTQMMTSINSAIVSRTGTIRASITSMGNGITTALNSTKTQAESIAQQMMTSINSAITSRTATVKASATALTNAVINALKELPDKGAAQAEKMMNDIVNAINSKKLAAESAAKGAANSIIDGLKTGVSAAKGIGESLIDGAIEGMNNRSGSLYSTAQNIINTTIAKMKQAADSHSPSRRTIALFEDVMRGAIIGLQNMENPLYKQAEDITTTLLDMFTLSPEISASLTDNLKAMTEANPFYINANTPALAHAGATAGVQYSTTLVQNVTTPKPYSESELTREGQDLLKRTKWLLP